MRTPCRHCLTRSGLYALLAVAAGVLAVFAVYGALELTGWLAQVNNTR